jgi:hypothetical protein
VIPAEDVPNPHRNHGERSRAGGLIWLLSNDSHNREVPSIGMARLDRDDLFNLFVRCSWDGPISMDAF